MNLQCICNNSLLEQLKAAQLGGGEPQSAETLVEEFTSAWQELGRQLLEVRLQGQIETFEATYTGCRQRRTRRYQTPLGTIELTRRVYDGCGGGCRVDQTLELPDDGWFKWVKELASALGVGSEFGNANRLLQRWSGIELSEKTLANHVEGYGAELVSTEDSMSANAAVCPIRSSVSAAAAGTQEQPVFYIGADGIHTPMQQGGTCEAKVGVMFWQENHRQVYRTRGMVSQREYIATLETVDGFREHLNRCYGQTVQHRPHQVVFLGDGAAWIWAMAAMLFPGCIEILDFFHLSEYLWQVARCAFVAQESSQKAWVERQQQRLKQSQWPLVLEAVGRLPPGSSQLHEAVERLVSYINHNQQRIDYQRYLQQGLMIGSGVVESSNRRIVTMRLKQSGMFWSKVGAEAVMRLRACYLSSSSRWHDFWYNSDSVS